MDTIIGITGKDFVLLVSDASVGRSIVVFKQDEDKMEQISNRVVMAMSGGAADRDQFGSLIKRNIILKELRNQRELSTAEIANFTRAELHESVRKAPVQVNILIGGVDENIDKTEAIPSLYYMDYLASMVQVPFGVQGHASNFCLSLLDATWKKDLNEEEVIDLFKKCCTELNTRFLISFPAWKVRILTKDGVREIQVQ